MVFPLTRLPCPPPLPPTQKHPSSSSLRKSPPKEKEKEKDANVVVSRSSSIARLARRGLLSSAASAFSLMLSEEEPNHITILTLLSACADFPSSPSSLPLGLSLHARLLKLPSTLPPARSHVALSTALVDMYAKNSLPSLARQLFDRIPHKNSFSFNTMLAGHMRNRQVPLALSLFQRMPLTLRDSISWTAIVDGLVKNGFLLEALHQFQQMQTSAAPIQPDYVLLVALVSACAGLGALNQGMWFHRYSMARPELSSSVRLVNSLIDMYSRCGRPDLAHQVFAGVQGGNRTRVTWNSMIVGFAVNGCSAEALRHFAMMEDAGFEPDGVSYTGALTACSHAGLVEEGLRFYEIMRRDGKVVPRIEHYGCVVDLLARAGRLEEAMGVVESMMLVMRPNNVVLGSLLAACRVRGDVGLAEKLMGYMVDLEPESDSNYVLLSNIYASAGEWDGAGKVRGVMKSLGVRKRPGFSMVEIDGALHEFVAGDRGHLQTGSIYDMLKLMCSDMKLQEEVG
ncbi:putative pentatricopeptide repeat-containing protein, chloroplastic [Iris pallida]|uniref:Pentatricopeptide repeat-containing protein, chloroplastic n=1 Tax=Iris pallida TaxID=29817 RepID=A0AAX6EEF7_IRIPA|nr:putative pentatricopeptide repeat-containing protein, chloroplastic [Iris pallida]